MPNFNTPTYSDYVLKYSEKIVDFEARYPTASGWDRYMLGRKANQYRGELIELEAGFHRTVLGGRDHEVCVCGLNVPLTSRADKMPDFLETPGHLDSNGQPTKLFFFKKYLAPQHYETYLICQACHVIEKVQSETAAVTQAPRHNCQALVDTLDFQI